MLRRIDHGAVVGHPLARHLFGRERRALALARELGVAPPLLYAGRRLLVRGFIDGVALHLAKPHGDRAYFRSAKAALRKLHRAGICHNDLAKEQNWLRGGDGRAYLTDFQLAACFRRRGRLFRDRGLRGSAPSAQAQAPLRAGRADAGRASRARAQELADPHLDGDRQEGLLLRSPAACSASSTAKAAARGWSTTRPRSRPACASHPQVRDAAVVAFPDRRIGTGLYAFVEAPGASERALRDFVATDLGEVRTPEKLQVVDALPRDAAGSVRSEILQLVAMNQVDLIDPLLVSESERTTVARIIADRRNLRDRTAFQDRAPAANVAISESPASRIGNQPRFRRSCRWQHSVAPVRRR